MAPVLIGSGAFNTSRIANTSIYQNAPSVRAYVASTGRRIAIIEDASGNLTYRTSADGVTWASSATLVTAATGMGGSQYISDTLYWFGWDPGTTNTTFYKSAFNTGTFAFAAPTTVNLGSGLGGPPIMAWDSTNSVFHALFAEGAAAGGGLLLDSINTSGSIVKQSNLWESGSNLWPYIAGILCVPGTTSTVYVVYFTTGGVYLKPATYNPANIPAYALGTTETVATGTFSSLSYAACALDNSNNVDIVYSFPGTSLNAIRRTGTNTYSGSTSLVASGVPTVRNPSAINLTTDGSGGLLVTYPSTSNQANGEIYGIWRPSGGSWGSSGLIAGGASTGFQSPRASATMASARTDILYTDGTGTTGNTYYVSYTTGNTPNTPTNVSPSNASFVGSTTPSFAYTYSNVTPTDTQSAREIKVVRTSDSVVMWDSGKVTDTASSGIVYGATSNTGDVNYVAPASLVNGVQYQWQVKAWDTVTNTASAYSTATTFTPAAAGVAAITAVAGSSGAASSSVKTSTLANATSLPIQTGDHTKFTNGQKIAVGTSPNIDIVTISSAATDTLTVSAMTHAHTGGTPGDAVVEADSTSSLGTPTGVSVTWAWNQAQSDTANAYQINLYQSDGVTLVATTSGAVSPTEANGASFTVSGWNPSGLANSLTYKMAVILTDTTTSVQATSPLWTVNTSWTPPAAPTGFTATPVKDSGYVQLNWTNPGSPASVNVLMRQNGTANWTTVSSGLLINQIKILSPLSVAQDYGVQTVSSVGLPSTTTTVTNVTLGLTSNTLGYWLCDVTNPLVGNVVLGVVRTYDESSTMQHHEDKFSYVPMGRTMPIASYGLMDYYDSQQRSYKVPLKLTGTGTTYTTTLANLKKLVTTHTICHFRDPFGDSRFVLIDNFSSSVDADTGRAFVVRFDLTDVAYPGGIVTA